MKDMQNTDQLSKERRRLLLHLRRPIEDPEAPYSTRNSSKGALLSEAHTLFSYLAEKDSLDAAREAVVRDNIFHKRTDKTRKLCWEVLRYRYFPGNQGRLSFHPIVGLYRTDVPESVKQGVIYYHYALSDRFCYEATVEMIYDSFLHGRSVVAPRHIHDFLDSKVEDHLEIKDWSPQTRRSLVSHYLSALRDFGILEGKINKRIHKPMVDVRTMLYIVTYLSDCGKSSKEILESNDFKLFLLTRQDVESRLFDADREGLIRFQRSGYVTTLDLPWRSLLGYIEQVGQEI